jgi:hypothetical protein
VSLAASDSRGLNFSPLNQDERHKADAAVAQIPDEARRQSAFDAVRKASEPPASDWRLAFDASEQHQVLVSAPLGAAFALHPEWTTTDAQEPFPTALADLLVTVVAATASEAAGRVAARASGYLGSKVALDATIGTAIACRLIAAADKPDSRVSLAQANRDQLSAAMTRAHVSCPKPPVASAAATP